MKTYVVNQILFICFFCYTSLANAYNLRQISNKDGLSNTSILSLGQDENHLMLFGTCDGLNIFDGSDIQIFRPTSMDQSIRGNIVEKIIAFPGAYCIRTNSGLNIFNCRKGEVLFFPEFAGHNFVFKNSFNDIFIYEANDKLKMFNEKEKQFQSVLIHNSTPIPLSEIHDIKFDSKNRIWIYTKQNICYCYILNNMDTTQPYIELQEKIQLPIEIKKAFPDGNNEFILDSKDVIYIFDSNDSKLKTIADISRVTLQKGDVSSILKLKDDFFVSFQTEGAVKITLTPEKNEPFFVTDLQIQCGVLSMLKDTSHDIVWFGTDGQGVYRYVEDEYSINSYLFPYLSDKIQKSVRAIFKDKYNYLWIGTRGDGIVRLPSFPSTSVQFDYFSSANSSLNENSVYAFAPSKKNILWIGSDGGLNYYSYDEEKIRKVIFPPDVEYVNFVHSIHETNDSTLWVTTGGTGVVRITLDKTSSTPTVKKLKRYINKRADLVYNYFFTSILNPNSLLVGNRGYGVFSLTENQDSLSNIYFNKTPLELAANDVYCIDKDSKGNLWLGTGLGLVEYSSDNKIEINKELNEFINSTIHGIVFAPDGNLWLSSNKGIIRYNPSDKSYQRYGQEEGVDVIEYCDDASYFDQETQTIFFGGINGFVTIHKESGNVYEHKFPIQISSLKVLGEDVVIADYLSQYKENNSLSLNYQQHSFLLKVSVADFIYNSSIVMYYRIKETDENWTKILNNTLNFTNMSHGEYTLEIKYVNQATNMQSDIYVVQISISPPWYSSVWAYIVYLIIVIICVYIAIYAIIRRNRIKKAQEIKKIEQLHQKEIYESKLEFFTNVASEFSTPLTLIFGPCQRIIENSKDKQSANYAKVIQRNAEILNDLTQEIVTYRSIESKEREPYIEKLPIGEIISNDLIMFIDKASSKNILFEKNISLSLEWNSDRFFLRTIVINLLWSAFQHTIPNGEISIEIYILDEELIISIAYIGEISDYELQAITNKGNLQKKNKEMNDIRFLRKELGLTMSYNMINLLKGEVDVEINNNKVCFNVKLPTLYTDKQHIKLSDIDPIHSANLKINNGAEIKEIELEFNLVRHTLFVIEQSKEMLWFLIDIFHEEYNIIPISNHHHVMKELRAFQPDLIIYDITGNINYGIELTEQLKNSKEYAHIPIILLSGERNIQEHTKGINAGAEMYIFKPFYSDFLKISVNKILNRKETLKSYFNLPKSAYNLSNSKLVHKEDKKFIEEILNIINANLKSNDLSAAMIAEKLNMSTRHLYRKLNEIGEVRSIGTMIKDCKLQVAKNLLINTKLSVEEIAYKSGFKARSTFFRSFTEKYQITPKEFRSKQE